jgi:opacity protein-like surface antigen
MKVLACLGIIASIFCASTSAADHAAVTEDGAYVSGGFTFINSGGDLFEVDGDRLTQIEFTPQIGYFVADGFGLGGSVTFSRQSQGDQSVQSMGIGPQFLYFFDTNSNALPFVTGELGLRTIDASDDLIGFDFSETGFGFTLGGGMMFLPSEYLGVHMALLFGFDQFDVAGSSIDGNQLGILVGLTGFLH